MCILLTSIREREIEFASARKCIFERRLDCFQFVFCALFGTILVHRGPVGWRYQICVLGGMACFVARDRLDLLNSLARALLFSSFYSFFKRTNFCKLGGGCVGRHAVPTTCPHPSGTPPNVVMEGRAPITTSFSGVLHKKKKKKKEGEGERKIQTKKLWRRRNNSGIVSSLFSLVATQVAIMSVVDYVGGLVTLKKMRHAPLMVT